MSHEADMRAGVLQSEAGLLLHNKFVVILGGSVQRSMYKDLVLLLQRDQYLTATQLKAKDVLVEGGQFGPMTNGTEYREVRQYRSDHHLLRFYFLTRVYSPYMESILEDLRQGLQPDVLVINSCLWDITRYGLECLGQYKENLHKFFGQIKSIMHDHCLILWALTMPVGKKIKGGFLVPELSHLAPTLRYDVIEANFYGGRLAEEYGFDVLDLHFHFRFSLQHRRADGIHWDALAHRHISSLLLRHAADAWGVELQAPPPPAAGAVLGRQPDARPHLPAQPRRPPGRRVPANGNWRLAGQGSRFHPPFQADGPWTRWRRGTHFMPHPYPPHLPRGIHFMPHPYPPHLPRGIHFMPHPYPHHPPRGVNFRPHPYPPHLPRGVNFRPHPCPPHHPRGTNFRPHPYRPCHPRGKPHPK
ncbi:PC-esterase domain-containing protein 1A-like isoform X2 [Pseudoliparis swirei]|uniref:PC-esterase domain-containing protein 1A-like isoform X2 n=1 Tax=Pseudoliparis swirei TaxID=2059687 RepID=UPI0024BD7C53|nr:PC-esterase domain-containing protein 1A-like isoform X2 [Pseudoliparis swirei]